MYLAFVRTEVVAGKFKDALKAETCVPVVREEVAVSGQDCMTTQAVSRHTAGRPVFAGGSVHTMDLYIYLILVL